MKCSTLRTLFLSSQLFNAGAWPELLIGEYKQCKSALLRVYKLACFDAYGNGGYEDDGSFSSVSESEIILRTQQVPPAVLLRVLRLLTSIRLAVKAYWSIWCLLFAAHSSKRSWTRASLEDVKWLAKSTSTFAELEVHSLSPWLQMAKSRPSQTAQAVHKICMEERAVQAAEALALGMKEDIIVPAEVADNLMQCRQCEYKGTAKQVQCHEQRWHGTIADITRCVDTAACSVCGLLFESVAINRRHSRESTLCKHNLLRRRPFLDDATLALSLDEDASFKTSNGKSGKVTMKTSKCCVRTIGPHRVVTGKDGAIYEAFTKGSSVRQWKTAIPSTRIMFTGRKGWHIMSCGTL